MFWFRFKVRWLDCDKVLTSYGVTPGYTYKDAMENIVKDFVEDNIQEVEISAIDNKGDRTFDISRGVYHILDEEVPFYDENEQEIDDDETEV